MKERGILFSAPMVRAILAGTKTQTRRLVKLDDQRGRWNAESYCYVADDGIKRKPWTANSIARLVRCPYGQPDDRLWVRETWALDGLSRPIYRASEHQTFRPALGWRPSIFMPRWASRITLEVTAVRVERLQEISEADAIAEGIAHSTLNDPRIEYRWMWETINGPGSWDANTWVWVIEFRMAP